MAIVIHEEVRNPEYLTHTNEHPYCDDPACPCHEGLDWQDEDFNLPSYEEASKPTPLTEQDWRDVINHAPWLW